MSAELGELEFHRLLVAVDGSVNADLALSAAVTAARRDHAAITLIAVSPDVSDVARWPAAPIDAARLQQDADEEAQGVLAGAVERIPADIPVKTVFRRGKAGPEIVALADCGEFDAVLLGARGVGRVGAFIGSVSGHVLHHAHIAVIVAHAPRPRAEAA